MSAGADDGRCSFKRPRDIQDVPARRRVRPPPLEISQEPSGPLDPQNVDVTETPILELAAEIFGLMKIRGREVLRVPRFVEVMAITQIPVTHSDERRIA